MSVTLKSLLDKSRRRSILVGEITMRFLIAFSIAASLLVMPAAANKGSDAMKSCAAAWKAMSPADQAKTTYKEYDKTCLKNGGPPAATPVAAATTPDTGKPTPTTQQQKMKDCAAKWQDAKKSGTTGGKTYKQFSADCLKG